MNYTHLTQNERYPIDTLIKAGHKQREIAQLLNRHPSTMSYFADPYASWQRGSNENTHGLVRQHLPKSRSFDTVTDEGLAMIMDRLNHRPRKRLNW
jgi:IS30 family transposase